MRVVDGAYLAPWDGEGTGPQRSIREEDSTDRPTHDVSREHGSSRDQGSLVRLMVEVRSLGFRVDGLGRFSCLELPRPEALLGAWRRRARAPPGEGPGSRAGDKPQSKADKTSRSIGRRRR